jgi:transposase
VPRPRRDAHLRGGAATGVAGRTAHEWLSLRQAEDRRVREGRAEFSVLSRLGGEVAERRAGRAAPGIRRACRATARRDIAEHRRIADHTSTDQSVGLGVRGRNVHGVHNSPPLSTQQPRQADPLHELLGEAFRGIVGCDPAKMYHSLGQVQWCWAHLARGIQSWIDSADGSAQCLGRDPLRQVARMFELWWKVRDGALDRAGFQTAMTPIREEVRALLRRGEYGPSNLPRATCAELVKHEDRLGQFVDHADIEPTNNGAERALRQAVILRKLTFGTQSAAGIRFVETMLTVNETCRQQGRGPHAFVTATLQARYHATAAPTLSGV